MEWSNKKRKKQVWLHNFFLENNKRFGNRKSRIKTPFINHRFVFHPLGPFGSAAITHGQARLLESQNFRVSLIY